MSAGGDLAALERDLDALLLVEDAQVLGRARALGLDLGRPEDGGVELEGRGGVEGQVREGLGGGEGDLARAGKGEALEVGADREVVVRGDDVGREAGVVLLGLGGGRHGGRVVEVGEAGLRVVDAVGAVRGTSRSGRGGGGRASAEEGEGAVLLDEGGAGGRQASRLRVERVDERPRGQGRWRGARWGR